jgi:hypothetical protein
MRLDTNIGSPLDHYLGHGGSLRFRSLAVLFLGILLFACLEACVQPTGGTTDIEKHSELFLQDTTLDPEGKTWVFETNDPAYWSSAGYTLWSSNGTSHAAGESWDRTYILTKTSGDAAAGYGVFFGYDSGPTMLTALINLQGKFCVGEMVDGAFQMLKDWTSSEDLNGTVGTPDTIQISYAGETKTYSVFLGSNSTAAFSFVDTVEPYHDGGEEGFLVVISYNDQFPQNPVRVVYEVP